MSDSVGPPLFYVIGTPLVGGLVGLWVGGKIASAKNRMAGRVVGAALGAGAGYGVFYAVANNSFATPPRTITPSTTTP